MLIVSWSSTRRIWALHLLLMWHDKKGKDSKRCVVPSQKKSNLQQHKNVREVISDVWVWFPAQRGPPRTAGTVNTQRKFFLISNFTSFWRHQGTPTTSGKKGLHKYKKQSLGYNATDTFVRIFFFLSVHVQIVCLCKWFLKSPPQQLNDRRGIWGIERVRKTLLLFSE